ncbi:ADP-ribosylglycohydrolase [Desulfonema limicola]|uniref:ADP-ribosylglycohydrolase n=1 Tax=Desulfonema limicola TaxID=45656 RepID=A0A975GIU8_9BACT|nr:ADP-ribosylglycohydrolase family protein [Desulfonema limicola]QTA82841.1 ADP-ribosylglycohydrolase [Desulfonema limicola]
MKKTNTYEPGIFSRFSGCLAGGSIGDALGAPVEFMNLNEILNHFGPGGISDYFPAYGKKGAVTDDTQMTLFTAEGLILSKIRAGENINPSQIPVFVYQAYLRWLSTQQSSPEHLISRHGTCTMIDGQLIMHKELYSRRAPGNSCLSALMSGKMGTTSDPVNNSKGCGGIMRIAPAGLFLKQEDVFDTACEIAAITHGHPTGFLASGCLAYIISQIINSRDILDAVKSAVTIVKSKKDHKECLDAINKALDTWKHEPVSFQTVEKLGKGWIAEEALCISLYCVLAGENDFEKSIILAVNHSGDSDSTGAITGNILGAMQGIEAIPEKYLKNLELKDIIMEISQDLFEQRHI